MRKKKAIAVTFLMLMSGIFMSANVNARPPGKTLTKEVPVIVVGNMGSLEKDALLSLPEIKASLLTSHSPIRINNNTDFALMATREGWKGNGTAMNPYIIENYTINGTGYSYCIYIGNTTCHFIVRNCYLHHADGIWRWPYYSRSGLILYNVQNGSIVNNRAFSNRYYGIILHYSDRNIIINNTASYSSRTGIYTSHSNMNLIINNTCFNNYFGIRIDYSSRNLITNNTAFNNTDGIIIYVSHFNNTIINNTVTGNYEGISVVYSHHNTVINNTASENTRGFYVYSSTYNTLINNTAISNNTFGFYVYSSTYNTLINNTATSNNTYGFYIIGARGNYIINNNASYNCYSLWIQYSTYNNFTYNTIFENFCGVYINISADYNNLTYNKVFNNYYGIFLNCSNNNKLLNNTVTNNSNGVYLKSSTYNTISNNTFFFNNYSIPMFYSASNKIINNSIINNTNGIYLDSSSYNTISNNILTNNRDGIHLTSSTYNTIVDNTIINNHNGIQLAYSNYDTVYHNKIINNTYQAYDNTGTNSWYAPYPTGGNYWSDYTGPDNYTGPNQDILGSDGFGDTPYTNILGGAGARDNYPLMVPWDGSDRIPPISTVLPISPYWQRSNISLKIAASDNRGLSNVTLYYRYSPDNSSWSRWSILGSPITISGKSWTGNVTFTFPEGDGYYEFYTIAGDVAGVVEMKIGADALGGYDTTDPFVMITSPANNSLLNSSTVTLFWNGSDETSGIDHYEIKIDNGSWTYVGTLPFYNITDLPDGLHTVYIKALDRADNENDTSVTITVDATSPSSIISSVSPYWQHSNVTLKISATDNYGLSKVSLFYRHSLDNSTWSSWRRFETSIPASGTSWRGSVVFTFPEGDGYYEFYTLAEDIAGHIEKKTYADAICASDTTAPSIIITAPFEGSVSPSNIMTVRWTGADALTGIDHYEIKRIYFSSWINVGKSTYFELSGLSDGTYTVYVKAVDKNHNENISFVTFTIDTGLPEITIITPSEGSLLGNSTVQIKWIGSDATSDIEYYEIKLDSSIWINIGKVTEYELSGLIDGPHTVYIKAVDSANNENVSSVTFNIDATPPNLWITSPFKGSLHPPTVEVTWKGTDRRTGIAHYEIRLDSGTWTDTGKSRMYQFVGLTDGEHIVYVKAVDGAGNEAVVSITFRVDATPPEVVEQYPMGNDVPVDVEIRITFSEKMNQSTLQIAVEGVRGERTWENNTVIFTPYESLEYNTKYTVYVRGCDLAGNSVECSWSFTTTNETEERFSQQPEKFPWVYVALPGLFTILVIGLLVARRKRGSGESPSSIEK